MHPTTTDSIARRPGFARRVFAQRTCAMVMASVAGTFGVMTPAMARALPAHAAVFPEVAPPAPQAITSPAIEPATIEPSDEERVRDAVIMLSVVRSDDATDSAGSSPRASGAERKADAPITNYRGETVEAAVTKFWEDFEDGAAGPEWSSPPTIESSTRLTKFSFVPEDSGMTLNLLTKEGQVYEAQIDVLLFPPQGEADDTNDDNLLIIKVDGKVVVAFTPDDIRKLRGDDAMPGDPVIRKIRVPLTAGYGIAEMTFEAAKGDGAAGWSQWGVDNILVDLGLQDPVFGISGEMKTFDPGVLGMVGPNAGMSGELPPASRFGNNGGDVGGGGGGGGGGSPSTQAIPTPGAALLGAIASVMTLRRRRWA
jgi:hypothetical protein